jgi:hypothetical protein
MLLNSLTRSSATLQDVSISRLFGRGLERRVLPLIDDFAAFVSAKRSTLRHLRLTRCTNGRIALAQGLLDALDRSAPTALETLVLADCSWHDSGPVLTRIVSRLSLLTNLDLSGSLADLSVLHAVAALPALRVLRLQEPYCGRDDPGPAVVQLLAASSTLEELTCAGIRDSSTSAVIGAAARTTALRKLRLQGDGRTWNHDARAIPLPAMLQLLRCNATLHELDGVPISADEFLNDELVDAFENDNFSLHTCQLPPRVEERGRFMLARDRIVCALNRNLRIVKWTAMRERVAEIAIGFADMRLPPYVLEEVINNEPDLTATRHWHKIRTLIAVQKFQNGLDAKRYDY